MIIDSTTVFSNAQAITATGTTYSTNVLDFSKQVKGDPGFGNDIQLFAGLAASFNNLTSLEIQVQTATDAAFTTPVVMQTTGPVLLAKLLLGYTANLRVLGRGCLGYLRLAFIVVGTAPTTGAVTAALVDELPESHHNIGKAI